MVSLNYILVAIVEQDVQLNCHCKGENMKKLELLIIDDHSVFASTLSESLNNENNIKVSKVLTSASGLAECIERLNLDALLMDIRIGKDDGLVLTKEIKQKYPHLKIILMSGFPVGDYAREFGADAFFPKEASIQSLVTTINDVCLNNRNIFYESGKSVLTDTELKVLKLLSEEMSNKTIAKILFISERTVNNHISEIYRKLEVQSRAGAAVKAVKIGLL